MNEVVIIIGVLPGNEATIDTTTKLLPIEGLANVVAIGHVIKDVGIPNVFSP